MRAWLSFSLSLPRSAISSISLKIASACSSRARVSLKKGTSLSSVRSLTEWTNVNKIIAGPSRAGTLPNVAAAVLAVERELRQVDRVIANSAASNPIAASAAHPPCHMKTPTTVAVAPPSKMATVAVSSSIAMLPFAACAATEENCELNSATSIPPECRRHQIFRSRTIFGQGLARPTRSVISRVFPTRPFEEVAASARRLEELLEAIAAAVRASLRRGSRRVIEPAIRCQAHRKRLMRTAPRLLPISLMRRRRAGSAACVRSSSSADRPRRRWLFDHDRDAGLRLLAPSPMQRAPGG